MVYIGVKCFGFGDGQKYCVQYDQVKLVVVGDKVYGMDWVQCGQYFGCLQYLVDVFCRYDVELDQCDWVEEVGYGFGVVVLYQKQVDDDGDGNGQDEGIDVIGDQFQFFDR